MADRSVAVRLRADVAGYVAGMRTAAKATADLARDAAQHAEANKRSWQDVGQVAAVTGGALVGVAGTAVASYMRFDKQMSATAAAAQATGQEMEALKAAALEAGKATSFSATEAAQAEEELAKAGLSVADITGGALKGALDLAVAGELDVAEAAEVAADAMVVFGKSGKDVPHIADLLAAAAGKAQGSVHEMGYALKQSALVAKQTGLSLEETVAALALFAANGLRGSDAGTSLKVAFTQILAPSDKAKALMDQLGISAFDASGNFIGLANFAQNLQDRLKGLTVEQRQAALATIFGTDAIRAANILYEAGAQGVQEWIRQVDDSGYAAEQASKRLDNLAGDLEKLKGSLETALIQSGSGANSVLRDLVQGITAAVDAFNELPRPAQQSLTILGGLSGVAMLAAGGFLYLVPRLVETRQAMQALNLTSARMGTALRGLAVGAGALVTFSAAESLLDALSDAMVGAAPATEQLTNSLLSFARSGQLTGEAAKALGTNFDRFESSVQRLTAGTLPGFLGGLNKMLPSFKEADQNIKAIDASLAQLVQAGAAQDAATTFSLLAAKAQEAGVSTDQLRGMLPQYMGALASMDTQQKITAGSTGALGKAAATTAGQMREEKSAADQLKESIDGLNAVNQTALGTDIAFRDSLAALKKSLRENGTSMDLNTQRGRDAAKAFLSAAQAASQHAQAVADQTGSVEAGLTVLGQHREALIKAMTAAGVARAAAEEYADQVLKIPTSQSTRITQPGMSTALANTRALNSALNNLHDRTIRVRIITTREGQIAHSNVPGGFQREADGGLIRGYAAGGAVLRTYPAGGMVLGPGTSTSDSIPALLSNGEYVVRAAAVRRYGVRFLDSINAMMEPPPTYVRPTGGGGMGGVQISLRPILIQLTAPGGQVLQQVMLRWKRESGQVTLGL